MPNTLAHLAVHGLLTRSLIRKAELPWVYAGAVIPDLPWILQRAVKVALPGLSVYDLRLYAVNQSSLAVCLVLCAALALLAYSSLRIFGILSIGCVLHLLLDACEIKWANGVNLLVPFDWRLLRFDFFWPESIAIYALTLGGLAYFFVTLRSAFESAPQWSRNPTRWGTAMVLVGGYFLVPIWWMPEALAADSHYVATIEAVDERKGKSVEMDRVPYHAESDPPSLEVFSERIAVVSGLELDRNSQVSVRGEFVRPHTLAIHDHHVHHDGLRDLASYVGLTLVAGLWVLCLLRARAACPSTCPRSCPR